jgi:pimeloyl-ACP methyl ester carboxylesterase
MRAEIAGRALALAGAVAAALALAPALAAAQAVIDVPVTFTVNNVDRSKVSCPSDGRPYSVHGDLIAPATALADPGAVTLYAHGLGLGEWFWHFTGVPGYDFATQLAQAGHASVVIDRLGYGQSGKPAGTQVCLGSAADYLHQIVSQLRAGSYAVTGPPPTLHPAFSRVALAGHSAGGYMAQAEDYSFHDVGALMILGFDDAFPGPSAGADFAQTQLVCTLGGQRQSGTSGPPGYAYFGQTDAQFQSDFFFDADPAVVSAATKLRARDPCGDTGSIVAAEAADALDLGAIDVPVLLLDGANDQLFPPPGGLVQSLLYAGSPSVTQMTLADTGHAMTLGRTEPQLESIVAGWLSARGF